MHCLRVKRKQNIFQGSFRQYLRRRGQAEDLRVLMGWRSPEMIRRYVKAAEPESQRIAHTGRRAPRRRVLTICPGELLTEFPDGAVH